MNTAQLMEFCRAHRLPGSFRRVMAEHYVPLARWLLKSISRKPALIGICGAQGTGKSTLAEFLALELKNAADWNIAVLSMDDFYFSRSERLQLSGRVHPLLATRGPPGTHDCGMMDRFLGQLRKLGPGESMGLPRFDKARDDRAPTTTWPNVTGPLDAIILEGWCLGVPPQDAHDLAAPINDLETRFDIEGVWRTWVNDRLRDDYARVFSGLDRLIFLQAPDMGAVLRWRTEQEQKLAARTAPGESGKSAIMNEPQLREFVQHFERLSRVAMSRLPAMADATLLLDSSHEVRETRFRS